jgi:glycosyltransferase involved in cell wall biosynthesis
MNNGNKSLSICLPALNEAANIEAYTREIYAAASELLSEFEIIIVDDGSTDNTYEIALNLKKQLGIQIKIIKKNKNEGIGPALESASKIAQYKYFLGLPSDGAYLIEGVKKIFSKIGDAPLIISYRENINTRPFFRKTLSQCVTYYVLFLSGKKINDAQSAIVVPTDLYRSININLDKHNCQMQIATRTLKSNLDYIQIPVNYSLNADKQSGMIKIKVLVDVIKSSLHLFYLKLIGTL